MRHLVLPLLILLPVALHAAPPVVLHTTDFEDASNALPTGWLPVGGQWVIGADETNVLQQAQATFRGQARMLMAESNYELSATARPTAVSGQWGVGLVGYWQPSGCYRLSNYGNVLALWREEEGQAQALAALRMEMKPQAYRLRLALQNEGNVTSLRGRIWALGEREPETWTITAQDVNRPFRSGRAGLFTGRAAAIFSDFALTRLAAARPAEGAEPPAPVPPGNHWLFCGGDWQVQEGGLRQQVSGSTPGFKSAAYAVAAGWSDYTVRVNAKSATGSRNQGFGLIAYRQDDANYYELGQANGALFLSRRASGADPGVLATVPLNIKRGLWYVLKLSVTTTPDAVELKGKVWPETAGEPTQWQLQAQDPSRRRLTGGDVGLWCLDDVCSFDDLIMVAN